MTDPTKLIEAHSSLMQRADDGEPIPANEWHNISLQLAAALEAATEREAGMREALEAFKQDADRVYLQHGLEDFWFDDAYLIAAAALTLATAKDVK